METTYDIAVVGGGASGLAAAIAAATPNPGAGKAASVCVVEQQDRVGKPILLTGNGRCNLTNEAVADGAGRGFRNPEFVARALQCLREESDSDAHDPVLGFFEDIGLEWREEADGRRYPLANKASVVVDVLRAQAAHLGVVEACGMQVASIDPPSAPGGLFTLKMADGMLWRCRSVVLAGGCKTANALAPEGVACAEPVPVLGPLRVAQEDMPFTAELDNIRVKCCVQLLRPDAQDPNRHVSVASELGELLFRKYGVSGICVYDLSRLVQPGDALQIDFFCLGVPKHCRETIAFRAKLIAREGEALTYKRYLRGLVLPRVADALLKRAGVPADSPIDEDVLYSMLCACTLVVEGPGPAQQCQVVRGGIDVAEVDPSTMQLRRVPGMFATGEAVDVDGPCGGYNLHWAWASGLLAGHAAATLLAAE